MSSNSELSKRLLDWYETSGRELPWRVKGGAHPDPYAVLVSEFMLQQTTVKTVLAYFPKFMNRFPTVEALAAAALDEVYQYWQGLGYYSRARSLHTAAQEVVAQGGFPRRREDILKLKGIGDYTAASFAALAFNLPETVVDGNVIRIICRLYHLTAPVAEITAVIREKAAVLTDRQRPADYASAIMDLGAVICTPKNPQCLLCPWQAVCQSKDLPDLTLIPQRVKLAKKAKRGFVYLIFNRQGQVLIRQRTETGLLSGLYEFPWSETEILPEARDIGAEVVHIFTHFKLTLRLRVLSSDEPFADGKFVASDTLGDYPFSTLMKKVYAVYQSKMK